MISKAQLAARVCSWHLDLSKESLLWSDSVREVLRIQPDAFGGKWQDFRRFIFPEDLAHCDSAYAACSPASPFFESEYRMLSTDGKTLCIYERGTTEYDGAGSAINRSGILMDITEQRASRELAAANATLLRIAGKAAKMGGWTIELPSRELTWSDENCAIHDVAPGYKPTLEEGINLYPPECREQVIRHVEACGRDGVSYDFELPKQTIKGRKIWVRSIGEAVRDADGKIIRLQGAFQDITERKQLESQLIQSQKLESVGKLAGGIAHEFNGIMTVILGHGELVAGDLPANHPSQPSLEEISKAAHRAAKLTRQLLACGQKQMLSPEIIDLNEVILGMEGVIRLLTGSKTELLLELSEGLSRIQADAGQLEQVITNMVINSVEAMSEGGSLTLETKNVLLKLQSPSRPPELKEGTYVLLVITDTGAGMSEEVKSRIFEPFFTTKQAGKGTGLGLASCYGIVKQSGGHINLASQSGGGSTFNLYFPAL